MKNKVAMNSSLVSSFTESTLSRNGLYFRPRNNLQSDFIDITDSVASLQQILESEWSDTALKLFRQKCSRSRLYKINNVTCLKA